MTIREAVLSDAAEITRLTIQLGYPAEVNVIAARLARVARSSERIVLVSLLEAEVVGWLEARGAETLESEFRVEIVGLVVSEGCRRRGVGSLLVQHAERWASKLGASTMVVRSNTKRVESHPFYAHLGFTETKTQAVYRKVMRSEPNPSLSTSGKKIA